MCCITQGASDTASFGWARESWRMSGGSHLDLDPPVQKSVPPCPSIHPSIHLFICLLCLLASNLCLVCSTFLHFPSLPEKLVLRVRLAMYCPLFASSLLIIIFAFQCADCDLDRQTALQVSHNQRARAREAVVLPSLLHTAYVPIAVVASSRYGGGGIDSWQITRPRDYGVLILPLSHTRPTLSTLRRALSMACCGTIVLAAQKDPRG